MFYCKHIEYTRGTFSVLLKRASKAWLSCVFSTLFSQEKMKYFWKKRRFSNDKKLQMEALVTLYWDTFAVIGLCIATTIWNTSAIYVFRLGKARYRSDYKPCNMLLGSVCFAGLSDLRKLTYILMNNLARGECALHMLLVSTPLDFIEASKYARENQKPFLPCLWKSIRVADWEMRVCSQCLFLLIRYRMQFEYTVLDYNNKGPRQHGQIWHCLKLAQKPKEVRLFCTVSAEIVYFR